MPDLMELAPGGGLRLRFHPGQKAAWRSRARFVAMLAGTQGGKTVFGPHWLHREICRRGPGDYLVVTPTFTLLELKALPSFRGLFEDVLGLGRYVGSPVRRFQFSARGASLAFREKLGPAAPRTQVFFGYAADPESLESATAMAAWLDEAGQRRFHLASWQAVLRRLSIAQGRALITTTPYSLGWLKQQVYDRWLAGDPLYHVVQFASNANPAFPQAEFERARRELPAWKFNLFYQAQWDRPAGLIYDRFDPSRHVVADFTPPIHWPRTLGLDFGGVNTAAVFAALDPDTGRRTVYREYLAGQRSAAEHVAALLAGEPEAPLAVGGSRSEGQWRREFAAAGLAVAAPAVADVEVGISRVYAAMAADELRVCAGCEGLLADLGSYSRRLDEHDQPTEEIEDKASYHLADALRYLLSTPAAAASSVIIPPAPVCDPWETRGW